MHIVQVLQKTRNPDAVRHRGYFYIFSSFPFPSLKSGVRSTIFGLMKYRVETVCHTAFLIVKLQVENIQPNIPIRASTSPVIITSAEKFTAVFPVCLHAFCLPAGSGRPVRTLYTAYTAFSLNIRSPSLRIFIAAL